MPGEAGSPYWAAVDFDSEGDEEQPPGGPNHRVYIDPWDNEAYGLIQQDAPESSQGENFNSFAGEPVSASFYYVPTKNYDSGEEPPSRRISPPKVAVAPEYAIYGRKLSRAIISDYHPDMAIYSDNTPMRKYITLYKSNNCFGFVPLTTRN